MRIGVSSVDDGVVVSPVDNEMGTNPSVVKVMGINPASPPSGWL